MDRDHWSEGFLTEAHEDILPQSQADNAGTGAARECSVSWRFRIGLALGGRGAIRIIRLGPPFEAVLYDVQRLKPKRYLTLRFDLRRYFAKDKDELHKNLKHDVFAMACAIFDGGPVGAPKSLPPHDYFPSWGRIGRFTSLVFLRRCTPDCCSSQIGFPGSGSSS